jgi:YVTN family beta-propeller protein
MNSPLLRVICTLTGLLLATACGKGPNEEMNLNAFPNQLPEAPHVLTNVLEAPSWLSGHPIVADEDHIYVADRDNGALKILDADTLEVLRAVPVGGYPEQLVVDPNGSAWVVCRDDGHVARVPADAALPDLTVIVGTEPIGIALSVDGSRAYISVRGSQEIVVLDTLDGSELQRTAGGARMRSIAVSPKGWLGLVLENAGIQRIKLNDDGSLDQESTLPTRRLRLGLPSEASMGFVARGTSLHGSRAVGATLHPGTGAMLVPHTQSAPGASTDGNMPATGTDSYGGASSVDNRAFAVASRPVDTVVTVVDESNENIIVGRHAVQDPTTGAAMHTLVALPMDIAHHPTHSIAIVVGEGTDNVLVLNTLVPDPIAAPIGVIDVGMGPRGVAFSPDGDRAFVLNAHSFTVSELDMTPFLNMETLDDNHVKDDVAEEEGGFGFDSHDMAMAPMMPPEEGPDGVFTSVVTDTFASEFVRPIHSAHAREASFGDDPASEAVRRGRQIFFDATSPSVSHAGTFACATCHLEGGDDGLIWMTTGPMQTIQLNGRLADTGPFNWLGTKPNLLDNMGQTIDRMGGDGLSSAQLGDLQAFLLEGLRAPINPHLDPAGLTEIQQDGKAIFHREDVGCASCHSGETFTNGEAYDVSTSTEAERALRIQRIEEGEDLPPAGFFNTPSLRGAWRSAPYMHNGIAADLREALEVTSGTMGDISMLEEYELVALVEYLKTL